jgi:Ni,Fe-hydrogenase maturation factor
VEGARFTEYGDKLSPEVEAAIPKAVAAVLGVIGADTDLLAAARRLSCA